MECTHITTETVQLDLVGQALREMAKTPSIRKPRTQHPTPCIPPNSQGTGSGSGVESDEDGPIEIHCQGCYARDFVYICLTCANLGCGRDVNQHALSHYNATHHPLAIDVKSLVPYCYNCNDFTIPASDATTELIESARTLIKTLVQSDSADSSEEDNVIVVERLQLIETHGSEDGDVMDEEVARATTRTRPDAYTLVVDGADLVEEPTHLDATERAPSRAGSKRKLDGEVASDGGYLSASSPSQDIGSSLDIETPAEAPAPVEEAPAPTGKGSRKKKANYMANAKSVQGMRGLRNLGNTCFMNSILQMLSNAIQLRDYFLKDFSPTVPQGGDPSAQGPRTRRTASLGEVSMSTEFCHLLREIWSVDPVVGPIAPESFFSILCKAVPIFKGYQQQDAQEFLRFLLDRLHTELSARSSSETTIIWKLFRGVLWNKVTCLECGNVSDKEDPFLDLSLDIPEKFVQRKNKVEQRVHPCTIYDCLQAFTDVEELADTERYECERCKVKQRSTKKFTIKKLPDILCLHLKRFRWSRLSRSKIDTYVYFPIEGLDMSKYSVDDKKNNLYDLFAAVVHHGSGPQSGHYTTYCWHHSAYQWFNLNDTKVTPSNGDVVQQDTVYMLFYKRRRIRSPARQVELLSLTTPVSTPSSSAACSPVSSPDSSAMSPPGFASLEPEPGDEERAKRGRNTIAVTTPNHTDEDEAAERSSGSVTEEREAENGRGKTKGKRGKGTGRGRGRPRTKG